MKKLSTVIDFDFQKLSVIIVLMLIAFHVAEAQQFSTIEIDNPITEIIPQPIYQLIKSAEKKEALSRADFDKHRIPTRQDKKALIEVQFGFDSNNEIPFLESWKEFVEKDRAYKNVMGLWIDPLDIIDFAKTLPEEYFILTPSLPIITQTGDSVTNATSYMNNVNGGLGLKVAIFEPHFGGVYTSQANGTIPTPFYEHDFSGSGDPFDMGGVHGTGVTEVIYHFAPNAEYHLYKFTTKTQFADAMADAITEGIEVINLSLGFLVAGWDDGSGIQNQAVLDATAAGIIVFVAAGNDQINHWQGDFKDDADSDNLHEWEGIDEGNDIVVLDGTSISTFLQWKGNPTSTNNFNIELRNGLTGDLLASTNNTSGYESLGWTNTTGGNIQVAVLVKRVNSTQEEFEIVAINGSSNNLQYGQTGGATMTPANAADDLVVVVGAVSRDNYGGIITYVEPYSSRGPSNDGRILPDILAPTDLITYTYSNGFPGTSSATPCMTGIALLFWSEHDYLTADGLIDLMYGFSQLYNHWGFDGPHSNEWGRGGIALPNYTANSRFIMEEVTNNDVNDRPYNSIEQADAIAPTNLNLFFLGGDFDPPTLPNSDVLDKQMIYRSLEEDVLIKN